jgi:hypothetical protein
MRCGKEGNKQQKSYQMVEACGKLDMWRTGTQSYHRKCLCSQIPAQLVHQFPIFDQHQHSHHHQMLRVELALALCTPQHKTKTGSDLFREPMTYKHVLDQD